MKVTLITGGSRGIGRATAIRLVREGHKIVFTYKSNAEMADKVIEEIRTLGGESTAIQADVSNENQIVRLFETIDFQYGAITALVNNAGILRTQSKIEEMDFNRLELIFRTNVIGSFLCAKEAVKRMAYRYGGKGGSIINVSSVASRLGAPNEYIDYASSKGAMDSLTTGLALEVADQGIRVNSVRPGFIYTDIHQDGGEADRVDRVKSCIPMKRGGNPSEVADAISWLLSDQASYVTGNFIDLAGGK